LPAVDSDQAGELSGNEEGRLVAAGRVGFLVELRRRHSIPHVPKEGGEHKGRAHEQVDSIDRTAGDPGSPNRDSGADPVAP